MIKRLFSLFKSAVRHSLILCGAFLALSGCFSSSVTMADRTDCVVPTDEIVRLESPPLDISEVDVDDGLFYNVPVDIVQWSEGIVPNDGRQYLYYVPDNPIGLVYFFHRRDSGIDEVQRLDIRDVIRGLIDADFAIVAFESEVRPPALNPTGGQWDIIPDADNNKDWERVKKVRDNLIANTDVTSATWLFVIGFSDGGSFTYTFGRLAREEGLPIAAIGAFSALYYSTTALIVENSDVPTFIQTLGNDQLRPEVARLAHLTLKGNDVLTVFCLAREKALNPERFIRIPGVDDISLAEDIFQSLADANMISDEEGKEGLRKINLSDTPFTFATVILPPEAEDLSQSINWQVRIVFAMHNFSNEYKQDLIAFFLTSFIIAEVEDLVDTGVLNQSQGNVLTGKMETAVQKLNQGKVNAAINHIRAFINEVNTLIMGETLLPTEGQALTDAANDIITQLSGLK